MSHPGATVRSDALANAIREVVADDGPDAGALWAAAPTALLDHARPQAQHTRVGRWPAARTLLASAVRGRGSILTTVDDILVAYEGANPGATLAPVVQRLAEARGVEPRQHAVRPSARSMARHLRALRSLERALTARLTAPVPDAMTRALHAAVRAMARAEAALDSTKPRLVLVASQHSTSSRSLIQAARARALPTAYLPHAPVADSYQYRDLPTDHAALRGRREVAFYRELGVAGDLAVVGNPQVRVDVPQRLDPAGPLVYAPRPQALGAVRAQVEAISRSASVVVVSPHPRMEADDRYATLWPEAWEVHRGRTADLFQRGVPCVLQASSGVAWEAMAHGIPVIDLTVQEGRPPSYPLIAEPHARLCDLGPDLDAAIVDARVRAGRPSERRALEAWAAEWCEWSGDDAAERAAAWVDRTARDGRATGALLDAWGPAR